MKLLPFEQSMPVVPGRHGTPKVMNEARILLYNTAVPATVMLAETVDGLLFDTVHAYTPAEFPLSLWVYCDSTGSSNTVSVPSVTATESLIQVILVAGPPEEMQVMVK